MQSGRPRAAAGAQPCGRGPSLASPRLPAHDQVPRSSRGTAGRAAPRTCSGDTGRKGSSCTLASPAVYTRRWMPSRCAASTAPKVADTTPMLPTCPHERRGKVCGKPGQNMGKVADTAIHVRASGLRAGMPRSCPCQQSECPLPATTGAAPSGSGHCPSCPACFCRTLAWPSGPLHPALYPAHPSPPTHPPARCPARKPCPPHTCSADSSTRAGGKTCCCRRPARWLPPGLVRHPRSQRATTLGKQKPCQLPGGPTCPTARAGGLPSHEPVPAAGCHVLGKRVHRDAGGLGQPPYEAVDQISLHRRAACMDGGALW